MEPHGVGNHIVDPRVLSEQVEGSIESAQSRDPPVGSLRPSPATIEGMDRRPSIPSIHVRRPSAVSSSTNSTMVGTPTVSVQPVHISSSSPRSNEINNNLYSDLQSFHFGDARPSHPSSHDTDVDPLSPFDRTPRPSVSGPSTSRPTQSHSSHPWHGPGRHASSSPSPSRPHHRGYSPSRGSMEDSEDPTAGGGSSQDERVYTSRHGKAKERHFDDTASQGTFGGRRNRSRIASPSASSSRSSSRHSSRSNSSSVDVFSDDEIEFDDNAPISPVLFAREGLADIDEDVDIGERSASSSYYNMFKRRGSVPIDIPVSGDTASTRSGGGTISTIRRPSRSLDDEIGSTHVPPDPSEDTYDTLPKSEPQSRGDWRSLEAHALAQQQQQQAQGLPAEEKPPSVESAYKGLDLQYIFSSNASNYDGASVCTTRRLSATPSVVQRQQQASDSSTRLFNNIAPWASNRKTSTTTLGTTGSGDDQFVAFVRAFDPHFRRHEEYWGFTREKADGESMMRAGTTHAIPLDPDRAGKTMPPGAQEWWGNGQVGRFKIDRHAFRPKSAPADKPLQQRLNVRSVIGPYSALYQRGIKTTGPCSVIHKHSKATAFSLFRSFYLWGKNLPATDKRHMSVAGGIMLAPKKVQEQYTSTKTTGMLNDHGHLDTHLRDRNQDRGGRIRSQNLNSPDDKANKDRKRQQDKATKQKAKKGHRSEQVTSAGSTTASSSSSVDFKTEDIIPSHSVAKVNLSSSTSNASTVGKRESTSSAFDSATEDSYAPSIKEQHQAGSEDREDRSNLFTHRDSIDSDEAHPVRTTYAETYSTLDPVDVEHLRAGQSNKPGSSSNGPFGWRRFFKSAFSRPDPAVIPHQNAYTPPWITTATRSEIEHNDRLIGNLNDSFRDVGLLHSHSGKSSHKTSLSRKNRNTIFDAIPDDCLYMILPLWPGEVDPPKRPQSYQSSVASSSFHNAPTERLYLLVWYEPFASLTEHKQEGSKKRSKPTVSEERNAADTKDIFLVHFKVVARLVRHEDFHGSGVRVPSSGLAVLGPTWEAESYSPANYFSHREGGGTLDPLNSGMPTESMVICQSDGREKGFMFVTEAFNKMGLCTPPPQARGVEDEPKVTLPSEEEGPERDYTLTPIGCAVIEMIWLGCLAVTSFG